jgi:hypothetical protein
MLEKKTTCCISMTAPCTPAEERHLRSGPVEPRGDKPREYSFEQASRWLFFILLEGRRVQLLMRAMLTANRIYIGSHPALS